MKTAAKGRAVFGLFAGLAMLAGCQSGAPTLTEGGNSAAVALLQHVNESANTCWIRSRDKEFSAYNVVPELDTTAGRPRILLIDKKAAHGLPKLVIEADGKPVKANAYGPLLGEPVGKRVADDLKRWTSGSKACTA